MNTYRLCALGDLDDPGSAGFDLDHRGEIVRLMAVRQGDRVYVYENSCPHRRLPLDFKPGQFLDTENKFILCSNHIALFRIEDGYCVDGPCKRASLKPFPVERRGGDIFVTL